MIRLRLCFALKGHDPPSNRALPQAALKGGKSILVGPSAPGTIAAKSDGTEAFPPLQAAGPRSSRRPVSRALAPFLFIGSPGPHPTLAFTANRSIHTRPRTAKGKTRGGYFRWVERCLAVRKGGFANWGGMIGGTDSLLQFSGDCAKTAQPAQAGSALEYGISLEESRAEIRIASGS